MRCVRPHGSTWLRWVLDVDIQHLRTFLDRRVTDGVIRWMIDKLLNLGVLHGERTERFDVSDRRSYSVPNLADREAKNDNEPTHATQQDPWVAHQSVH